MQIQRRFLKALTLSTILFMAASHMGCDDEPRRIVIDPPNGNDSIIGSVDIDTNLITLLGQIDVNGLGGINDVWGYVDSSGNEYALVGSGGSQGSLTIFDVTNPAQPVLAGQINNVPGFDVKVWKQYAYTVNGSGNDSGAVIDILDPANPKVVGKFPSSHNLFISENGYMYAEFPGLEISDLNPDPTSPTLVWQGGIEGHDATVVGDRLYDFHGRDATRIYDVSNPANPIVLGSIQSPEIQYNHSGWPTQDGNFLFICDELSNHPGLDFTMWDISDMGNPQLVGGFGDPNATIHNAVIIGNRAYTSYYSAGFRVFDISDPSDPILIGEYDTAPRTGEGFSNPLGTFGVYAFAPSGNIYTSDGEEGLFIFAVGD